MAAKVLLRGGCVLTLGAKTPNSRQADLLIEDGRVAEVGQGIRSRDAEVVDAADTIVMPGFVDTHRHTWTSLFRNFGDAPGGSVSWAPTVSADRYGPDDVYAATLVGLLGAVEAGITTVVDWSDGSLDAPSVEAALQAHADAGMRTVFVVGRPDRHDGSPADELRRLLADIAAAAGSSTSVALGVDESKTNDPGRAAGLVALARELGLRVHLHAGTRESGHGMVSELATRGLLGEHVTLVHGSELDRADLDAVASSGTAVSLAPSSEMAGGRGAAPIQPLVDRDIRPGLGIDDERVSPGDLFAQMRATISMQHATAFELKLAGKAGVPKLMNTRNVIRYATVDGARVAGLRGVTGSLEPGMQADVIVLRTDRPNIFPINDPIGAVVWGMDTSNVDWVFAGGRVLMREGVLQADVERAGALATEARGRVAAAAGLVGAAPGGTA
ncbi:MAG TPA: amidohydrolase family protein [Actinomycetota bacterium]